MNKVYKTVTLILLSIVAEAQVDSNLVFSGDTITNQDQIFNRPFVTKSDSKISIGGYTEANTNYSSTDGVTEGFSMEMRRFNIFMFSDISSKIKFLSELEFEHGTEEIALETAQLDFQFSPLLNLRAGVILPQIGLLNANHDSPKWEFIERPLSSTSIIPSTLSEVGFGIFGKQYFKGGNIFNYNVYITNGLQDGIVVNAENKTFIPSGKTPKILGEDNNGTPMLNARVAIKNRKIGELGFAYYGGTYNTFKIEVDTVSNPLSLALFAIDAQTKIKNRLELKGEFVLANIEIEKNLQDIYGNKQWAGFVDAIYTVREAKMMGFQKAKLNLSLRYEAVDFYSGNDSKFDTVKGFRTGVSFSPVSGTLFRANYGLHWEQDLLGNPAAITGAYQFGVTSYF